MKTYAADLLRWVLERAQCQDASEIRLISGMDAVLINKSGRHFAELAHFSQEVVRNVHQECLSFAKLDPLVSRASLNYAVVVPGFGRFRCNYHLKGNVASLTMRRDSGESALIDVTQPIKRPNLRAEARPEESAPKAKGKH